MQVLVVSAPRREFSYVAVSAVFATELAPADASYFVTE
jgi:hypothetical protein